MDLDPRKATAELAERLWQKVHPDRGAHPDQQRTPLQPFQLSQSLLGLTQLGKDPIRLFLQDLAGLCEADRPTHPVEELQADLPLQFTNVERDIRLAEVQIVCCLGKTPEPSDSKKDSELMEIHKHA